jgi:tetratricopeptide (TPR) repeat protein
MRLCNLILILFFTISTSLIAQEDLIKQAEQAAQSGNYDTSCQRYEEAFGKGLNAFTAHYNCSYGYYKLNNLGQAVYHIEKCLQIRPNDPNAIQVKHLYARQLGDLEAKATPPIWNTLAGLCSADLWAYISIGLFLLTVIAMVTATAKKRLLLKSSLVGITLISLALGYTRKTLQQPKNQSIVLKTKPAYSSPDPTTPIISNLEAGTKIQILDSLDTYYKIEVGNNNEQAWIDKPNLAKL